MLNGSDNEYAKFARKKWYVIDSESKGNYSHESPIKFLASSLQSNLCDYSDPYILVTANITVTPNDATTQVIFKTCAPFEEQTLTRLLLIMQILLIWQCLCKI